ncbi:amino acid adenylation protein [Streptomyces sp. ERV7]|uniref:AMP-binding protein n=1 Tax=Streptomyces sp. ERV7 TaxID=1322334 RepID=UPI0007F3DC11|nr:AMP-binding protein [Streptomyces sp. ERV7]OAR26944.1 amino acid adenylation protein [Streptomyces sp. ERV7]
MTPSVEAAPEQHLPPRALWGGRASAPCFLESFRTIVREHPDVVAVVDEDLELTYAQLDSWIGRIAALLVDQGITAGRRVAFAGSRGAPAVAAMLAVVSLGATYVPLDSEYPARRLAHMVADSGVTVLLHAGDPPDFDTAARLVPVPPWWRSAPAAPADRVLAQCRTELPVYIIYTSGSTGLPKGVAVPHSSCDNMVEWQRTHSVRPDLRTAQYAPLNFDVCFQEILGTLCGGGTLVVVPERLRRDPISLLDWLVVNRIERLFLPCVALHMLTVAATAVHSLAGLVLAEINAAGEQLVCTPAIRDFFALLPGCRLNNHYGQSESAMVTVHTLTGPSREWPALAPIGRPLPGCEVLIDPPDLEEPDVGELLVAGAPLSAGYLNQPQLSAERYVTVDSTPQGHTRAFRTGDLVRVDGDVLRYLSRVDHEVKIRGVRVNPVEVDACLLAYPGIVEAVCVAVEMSEGSRQLRAAVTMEPGLPALDTAAVRRALAERLPAQSLPQSVTVLSHLPRTPSGKIDRVAVTELLTRPAEAQR